MRPTLVSTAGGPLDRSRRDRGVSRPTAVRERGALRIAECRLSGMPHFSRPLSPSRLLVSEIKGRHLMMEPVAAGLGLETAKAT